MKFCPEKPGTDDFDLGNCRNDTFPSSDDFLELSCDSESLWSIGDEQLDGKAKPGSTCYLTCANGLELARDQRALDGITVSHVIFMLLKSFSANSMQSYKNTSGMF